MDRVDDEREMIRLATGLKKAGHKMFKAKKWDNALAKFQAALKKLDGSESDGAIKLKSTLWSYMSETYLKRGLTSDAIVAAHNAIAADAANQKGHLCLARALSAFGDCSVQIATGISMMHVNEAGGQGADDMKAIEKNWAKLPPNVIEKIVLHTVKSDTKEHSRHFDGDLSDLNRFALSVRKLGLVHPLWKRAIISSSSIFYQKKTLPMNWPPEKMSDIRIGAHQCCDLIPKQLIKEGYLQCVQWLCVVMEREAELNLICDALRARNAIVGINLKTDECYFSEKIFREMSKLVKLMTKATHFEIRIPITTKAEAKRLWKLLRMVCQTNDHAKMIKFDYGNPSGFDFTRDAHVIDWSFVNLDEPVGTVGQFYSRDRSPSWGFLSHLTTIGTLTIGFHQLWGSQGAYLDQTKAECLQIKTCISDGMVAYNHTALAKLSNVAIKRKVKVKTVEVFVVGDDFVTVKYQKTFDGRRASLWTNIKYKFLPVFYNILDESLPYHTTPQQLIEHMAQNGKL